MNLPAADLLKNFPKKRYLELFPKLKEEKIQRITEVILTFIAIPVFSVFAISPTISTIVELRKKITDAEYVSKSLREKTQNLNILQSKYAQLQPDLPKIYAAVPTTQKAPLFMAQIQGLTKKYNLTLNTVQFSTLYLFAEPPSQDENFSFSLSTSGDYQETISFISDLVNFERITTLDSIAINLGIDKKNTAQLTISGKVYFKK